MGASKLQPVSQKVGDNLGLWLASEMQGSLMGLNS